ncbi:MAG: hypothetical protein CVV62_01585 [Tenericutes bacterium HGW-Tenericutes-7]|nr:MAG: hypothetical protein CVV62_01585 [Tenericutes bacterium HGW-Tenericutes-7]
MFPLEKDWRRASNLNQWLKGVSGLGKVYFKFPRDELYPCLPIFHRNSLIFPLEGTSNCTISEVKLAKELGAKLILLDGYFYTEGTEVLSEYLQMLQSIRNKSGDPAQRQLLKLLSNSIIGKFFQKNLGINLQEVQKYAWEHQVPFEEALKLEGVNFGDGEVTVGSCFYPEWYALILGYARASISRIARKHQALIISSDSFVSVDELAPEFSQEGITYRLKDSGKLVSYRTRFYRVGQKLAHHAVHNREAGREVLKNFLEDESFRYSYQRIMHLKESWRDKKPFGCRVLKPNMSVSLRFDHKRRLLEDGTTVAWKSVEEREKFLGMNE